MVKCCEVDDKKKLVTSLVTFRRGGSSTNVKPEAKQNMEDQMKGLVASTGLDVLLNKEIYTVGIQVC